MSRRYLVLLLIVWVVFLTRGLFYSVFIPLWEGWDEYQHFAFVQHLGQGQGQGLPKPDERVSEEVSRSLRLVPLPWSLSDMPLPSMTHESFWTLPPAERVARVAELNAMSKELQWQPGMYARSVSSARTWRPHQASRLTTCETIAEALGGGFPMSTVIGNLDRVRSETAWSEHVQQLKSWMWKSVVVGAMALSEMPFLEHLEELRRRLISGLIAIAICSGLCLVYATELIKFLKQPAEAAGLALASYDSLEMFSIYFTVPLGAGICLAAPVILWQVWKFIEPALYVHEKRYARPFTVLTTICFVLGAAFGYKIVTPWLFKLTHALGDAVGIKVTPSASSYISTLTWTVVAMGAIFEMPPVVFILSRIGLVSAAFLVRNFKYAFLLFSVAAAILTPSTTIGPMIGFMGVMTGLYLVSILVAFIFGRSRKEA